MLHEEPLHLISPGDTNLGILVMFQAKLGGTRADICVLDSDLESLRTVKKKFSRQQLKRSLGDGRRIFNVVSQMMFWISVTKDTSLDNRSAQALKLD